MYSGVLFCSQQSFIFGDTGDDEWLKITVVLKNERSKSSTVATVLGSTTSLVALGRSACFLAV